jgi:hypothetical protein
MNQKTIEINGVIYNLVDDPNYVKHLPPLTWCQGCAFEFRDDMCEKIKYRTCYPEVGHKIIFVCNEL